MAFPTLRVALKRLLWLGLVLVGGTVIHLVLRYSTLPRLSPFSNMANHKDKVSTNTSHTNMLNTTTGKPRKIRFHEESNVSNSATPSTSWQAMVWVDKMVSAAARLKAVFMRPVFRFSNDVYFYPPETGNAYGFSRFLINPADTCSGSADSSQGSPFLMVLVLSSYLNQAIKEREAIRTTYGSVVQGKRWPGGKPLAASIRMVFVLGRPPSPQHRQLLEAESAQHGDVLVADFVDSYQNLTLKVLHGLHWVVQHCPQTKFVLKADDDVFINLPLLTMFLVKRGSNNSVYGHAYLNGRVPREGRWAVPRALYPFPLYPVYMSGTSYVMSIDAARKIVQASHWVLLVPVEDAFITGILPQITAVRRVWCAGFTVFHEDRPRDCEFVNDQRIVGNGMRANEKTRLWLALNSDRLVEKCAVKSR